MNRVLFKHLLLSTFIGFILCGSNLNAADDDTQASLEESLASKEISIAEQSKKRPFETTAQHYVSFYTKGNVCINHKNETLSVKTPFVAKLDSYEFSANQVFLSYSSLLNFTFDNINRIDSSGNVRLVLNKAGNKIITADRYVYTKEAQAHVLESLGHPVVYSSPSQKIITHDRIEYFVDKAVVVLRGNPIIYTKHSSNSKDTDSLSAGVINVKLNAQRDVDFIEASQNVVFKQNTTSIKADYAIYFSSKHQVEFYNNIVFKGHGAVLTGCTAIYNLDTQEGKVLPCTGKEDLEGSYHNS